MTAMDWNDLASQPLPSVNRLPVGGSNDRRESPFTSGGTQSLLGLQRTMDRPWMGVASAPELVESAGTVSVSTEAILLRHEQDILQRILRESRENTRRITDNRIAAQLQTAWEKDREQWRMEWMGKRHFKSVGVLGNLPQQTHAGTGNSNLLLELPRSPPPQPRMVSRQPMSLEVAQRHLEIVRRMEDALTGIAHLERIPCTSPAESAYQSAWHLVGGLVKRPGNVVEQAMATLEYLFLQFQSLVLDKTTQSSGFSDRTKIADHCTSFALVTCPDKPSPWAPLFYCIRCGHALAALTLYEQMTNTHPAVLSVLKSLAGEQKSSPCLRYRRHDQVAVISDLWESAQDWHERGCYALLSGRGPPVDSGRQVPGFSTVEDHLCFYLTKALLQDDPVTELRELGRAYRELGPDYFGNPLAGGWAFCQPLLLTQQYARAVTHLTQVGGPTGLMQATHLAFILHKCGVDVIDLGAPTRPGESTSLVSALIVNYANQLLGYENLGTNAALEYLVRIPDSRQSRQEVAKLIANTGEVERLVGSIDSNGLRIKNQSIIDMHYSATEIGLLLGDAAELLLRANSPSQQADTRSIGLAAMCYMLAERYADVLALLNQTLCPPDSPDDQRTFWLSQCEEFRSLYLSSRTHVTQVLERQGQLHVAETTRVLIELNSFFRFQRERRHDSAWKVLDDVQLLPVSRSDLLVKEQAYKALDPLVQQSFPAVMVSCLEMLCQDYRRLKTEVRSSTRDVMQERFKQMKEKANLIVAMAGLIGVSTEESTKLTQLESLLL